MKQTENYQLNQWEKPDRIMMEDFNADNAKLDAVIKSETHRIEHMPHGVLLCGGVTTEEADQIDLDVSAVDWDQYALCFIRISLIAIQELHLKLNRGDDSHTFTSNNIVDRHTSYMCVDRNIVTMIPVLYNGALPFSSVTFIPAMPTLTRYPQPLGNGQPFSLVPHYNFIKPIPAGTHFELWGVR